MITLLEQIVEFESVMEKDDHLVVLSNVTFKTDYGPWSNGEKAENLVMDSDEPGKVYIAAAGKRAGIRLQLAETQMDLSAFPISWICSIDHTNNHCTLEDVIFDGDFGPWKSSTTLLELDVQRVQNGKGKFPKYKYSFKELKDGVVVRKHEVDA